MRFSPPMSEHSDKARGEKRSLLETDRARKLEKTADAANDSDEE